MGRDNTLGNVSRRVVTGILKANVPQSTVMLAANVAFLAIPGVMFSNTNSGNLVILPSSSQIASLLSVESSAGSIVIGLLLIRHNRTKQELDPLEAVSEQSQFSFYTRCRRETGTVNIFIRELSENVWS